MGAGSLAFTPPLAFTPREQGDEIKRRQEAAPWESDPRVSWRERRQKADGTYEYRARAPAGAPRTEELGAPDPLNSMSLPEFIAGQIGARTKELGLMAPVDTVQAIADANAWAAKHLGAGFLPGITTGAAETLPAAIKESPIGGTRESVRSVYELAKADVQALGAAHPKAMRRVAEAGALVNPALGLALGGQDPAAVGTALTETGLESGGLVGGAVLDLGNFAPLGGGTAARRLAQPARRDIDNVARDALARISRAEDAIGSLPEPSMPPRMISEELPSLPMSEIKPTPSTLALADLRGPVGRNATRAEQDLALGLRATPEEGLELARRVDEPVPPQSPRSFDEMTEQALRELGITPDQSASQPLTVYHGSRKNDLEVISSQKAGPTYPLSQLGAFFSPDFEGARAWAWGGGQVYETTLQLKNPKELPYDLIGYFNNKEIGRDGRLLDPSEFFARRDELAAEARTLRKQLESEGHDGVIFRHPDDPNLAQYVSFRDVPVGKRVSGPPAAAGREVAAAAEEAAAPAPLAPLRGGEPPIEALPQESGQLPEGMTSLKNAVVKAEREARGLSEVEARARLDYGTEWAKAKERLAGDPMAGRTLAQLVIERPRALSVEDQAVLLHDKMSIRLQHKEALAAEEAALVSDDAEALANARLRRADLEQALNTNDVASRLTGSESGASLAARKLWIKEDYSPAQLFQRLRVDTGGKPIPKAIEKKLVNISKDIDAATDALNAAEDAARVEADSGVIKKLQKDIAYESRRAGRTASKEALAGEFESLRTQFRKLSSTPRAGLDPELAAIVGKMARNRVQAGVVELEQLVDEIYQAVRPYLATITQRDVRDAISGYGKTSQPSKNELAAQLREIRSQGRLVSALEDAEKGSRPLKSGFQRGELSPRVRELQRRVNEAMRVHGLDQMADPAKQMKSTLDAAKTRLKREIEDLNSRITTGAKPAAKTPVQYDAEALAFKAERDRLKQTLAQLEENSGLSTAQRVSIAERQLERRVQDLGQRIKAGDIGPRQRTAKPAVSSPRLEDLRREHAALTEQLQDMRKAAGYPDAARLKALKTRLASREAELKRQIAAGDFSRPPKRAPAVESAEIAEIKTRVKELQREADHIIARQKAANRSKLQKAMDWTVGWGRFLKLSGFAVTPQKLGAAATSRALIFRPLEELVGAGVSKVPVVRHFAAEAPVEGGGSWSAIAKSYAAFFSKETAAEMKGIVTKGAGPWDIAMGVEHFNPNTPAWMDAPGRLHGALKSPSKISGSAYAMEKQAQWLLKRGEGDQLLNPVVHETMKGRAKAYALDEIYQGHHELVARFNGALRERKNQGPLTSAAIAAIRTELPIVKVPVNFVTDLTHYAVGIPKTAIKMGRVIRLGRKKLAGETGANLGAIVREGLKYVDKGEADLILRQLKKGLIGAPLFALAANGVIKAGGYREPGQHRSEEDLQPGEIQVGPFRIPHMVLHQGAFEVIQSGAAVFRERELADGLNNALFGALEQVPFYEEPARSLRTIRENPTQVLGDWQRGMTIQPDVQRLARLLDQRGEHSLDELLLQGAGWKHINARRRKPHGGTLEKIIEEEMLGIPGLRPKVK